jgi:hypothetical protein
VLVVERLVTVVQKFRQEFLCRGVPASGKRQALASSSKK